MYFHALAGYQRKSHCLSICLPACLPPSPRGDNQILHLHSTKSSPHNLHFCITLHIKAPFVRDKSTLHKLKGLYGSYCANTQMIQNNCPFRHFIVVIWQSNSITASELKCSGFHAFKIFNGEAFAIFPAIEQKRPAYFMENN